LKNVAHPLSSSFADLDDVKSAARPVIFTGRLPRGTNFYRDSPGRLTINRLD
jgi:hypothetical protein